MGTMELPSRAACFACESPRQMTVWKGDDIELVACRDCGSEWVVGTVYSEQAYSYEGADASQEAYYASRARRFARYLSQIIAPPAHTATTVPMLLFDVGCGEGAFMSAAAKIGWQVIGTELTPEAAAHAHERTGLPVLSGDLSREALFRQTSCDALTLWGILEHVPNPDALIAGCVRLLRPGGVLLLETPNPQGLFRRVSLSLVRLSGKRFQQPFRQTLGAGHVVWYTTAGLRAAATHAGLEIVDIGGSRNSTRILLARWQSARPPARWIFQFATIVANHFARPLGRANQIHAALRVPQIDASHKYPIAKDLPHSM